MTELSLLTTELLVCPKHSSSVLKGLNMELDSMIFVLKLKVLVSYFLLVMFAT